MFIDFKRGSETHTHTHTERWRQRKREVEKVIDHPDQG